MSPTGLGQFSQLKYILGTDADFHSLPYGPKMSKSCLLECSYLTPFTHFIWRRESIKKLQS